MDNRSRRSKSSKQNDRFAQLRELKRTGRTGLTTYEVKDEAIFDEVDEKEYQEMFKQRVMEDDFVEDDDGHGYVDYGLDAWEDSDPAGSYDDDEEGASGADSKEKRKADKRKKKAVYKQTRDTIPVKAEHQIGAFFQRGRTDGHKKVTTDAQDDAFMSNLLGDLDQAIKSESTIDTNSQMSGQSIAATHNVASIYRSKPASRLANSSVKSKMELLAPITLPDDPMSSDYTTSIEAPKMSPIDMKPSLNTASMSATSEPVAVKTEETIAEDFDKLINDVDWADMDMDIDMDVDTDADNDNKPAETKAQPTIFANVDKNADCTDWTAVPIQSSAVPAPDILTDTATTTSSSSSFTQSSQSSQSSQWSQDTSILESDGTLRMYWFDAYEKNGTVYVFGKIYHRALGRFVSCCLTVANIERNVYFLKRDTVLDQDDQSVTFDALYEEVGKVCQQHRISRWAGKEVMRKYAFELRDIPAESTYLKMVYSYTESALPADLTGRTFSHVFGTHTSAMEQFIMKRKLMGPSWLVIKNPNLSSRNLSWCKVEVSISDPKHVQVLRELDASDAVLPPPPLTIMSLSLRVVMNRQKHVNEIVMGSALVYQQVNINDPTPVEKLPHEAYSVIRQLNNTPFPMGLNQLLQKHNLRTELAKTERALLNYLITMIYKIDPDIIVGHNFLGFDLDVLLHRMKANQIDTWSRLGRLRRTMWPKLQAGAGGMGETTFAERAIVSGRIICDTYLSAKDLIRSKSFRLTELASSQLKIQREDIEFEQIPNYFKSANLLVHLIRHCGFDNYLVISLMSKLQVLPLTRQLTSLAGNLWARTMSGARAERNEYLLLHEFHQRKFIIPDKWHGTGNAIAIDANDEGSRPKTEGRRKPAYAGGLVLEPKKGFYDKYVLMLDFNSLYPSIIQEFNICFTTVDRPLNSEQVPEVPDSDFETGILPRLLATLVDKRRQVKRLMKDPKCTTVEYSQYDIRQLALKLTANSMYGCLGFTNARFYAKSLAMLITSKGREILQSTVELAESKGLDVIYGDTDSIMIYTNTDDLNQVKEIGQSLKRDVNKRYRLLEIEMDGFYRRMLLLKKKKYAALMTEEKNGSLVTTMETKGLDLVRRDWCELSHDVSDYVLKQILSGDGREEILDRIHQYLMTVGRETRGDLVPIDKFVINKGLTKHPNEYADAKSQPHVQVAKRMILKGISVRTGDTVPFVICQQSAVTSETQPATGSYAERAHHPDDLRRPGSNLTIDFEWYLGQQVHPPVARLCAPIEGTDAGRLADCLGLDANKYRSTTMETTQAREFVTLDSQITDEERFHSVDKFFVRCPFCQKSNLFHGVALNKTTPEYTGLQCPNNACQAILPVGSIGFQLNSTLQKHIRKYQEGWLLCDDPSCQTRTRMLSVRGRRCGQAGCRGMLRLEYSDTSLYNQLLYLSRLFDYERARGHSTNDEAIQAQLMSVTIDERKALAQLGGIVNRYLERNARRYVDLGALLSFCRLAI